MLCWAGMVVRKGWPGLMPDLDDWESFQGDGACVQLGFSKDKV